MILEFYGWIEISNFQDKQFTLKHCFWHKALFPNRRDKHDIKLRLISEKTTISNRRRAGLYRIPYPAWWIHSISIWITDTSKARYLIPFQNKCIYMVSLYNFRGMLCILQNWDHPHELCFRLDLNSLPLLYVCLYTPRGHTSGHVRRIKLFFCGFNKYTKKLTEKQWMIFWV